MVPTVKLESLVHESGSGNLRMFPNLMIQFFKDRTGIVTQDTMYPPRIQSKTPKDIFSLFFTHGEHTSQVIDGETFIMTVPDGCALFSPSHTFAWSTSMTFTNIVPSGSALSIYGVEQAFHLLWKLGSIPDMIVTGPDSIMLQKAKEVIQYFEAKRGWKIEHVVCPHLTGLERKWRWFVVDSRKATGHYKKLKMGFSEVCVFTFDWIVASLSVTCPTLS